MTAIKAKLTNSKKAAAHKYTKLEQKDNDLEKSSQSTTEKEDPELIQFSGCEVRFFGFLAVFYLYAMLAGFVVMNFLNAGFCMGFLLDQIPDHEHQIREGLYWKPILFGFMDLLTFIRILVQAYSGVLMCCELCCFRKKKNQDGLVDLAIAAIIIASEQSLSLGVCLFRLLFEDLLLSKKRLLLEYMLVNYMDLVFYGLGLGILFCCVSSLNPLVWREDPPENPDKTYNLV